MVHIFESVSVQSHLLFLYCVVSLFLKKGLELFQYVETLEY